VYFKLLEEGKKMTERENIEWDIEWEKRAKKILLICSAVCCGLGFVIGLVLGISGGSMEEVLGGIFGGIWIGTGVGGAIGYFPYIPRVFMQDMRENGLKEALIGILLGILVWVCIFGLIGPVGLPIRILRMNFRIKKFEKRLSEL
jgi:MFS family permease